jgi:hypothetical protein
LHDLLARIAPALGRWKDRASLHRRLAGSPSHENKASVSQTSAAHGHRCSDRVAACQNHRAPYWQAPPPVRCDSGVGYQASVAWLSPVSYREGYAPSPGRTPNQNLGSKMGAARRHCEMQSRSNSPAPNFAYPPGGRGGPLTQSHTEVRWRLIASAEFSKRLDPSHHGDRWLRWATNP